jgi:MFS family permease
MAYFSSRLKPFVRAFIISDALLYSSLNIVNILFVLYVTTAVPGGTVQSATGAIAAGLVARIVVELSVGRVSSRLSEQRKLLLIVGGMAAISVSYAGFALSHHATWLILLWIVNGAGWAIGHPAKLALVARHINHEQASQEWGLADALNMSLVVVTMAVGAYIVSHFSYGLLFALAAAINTAGIVPYLFYARLSLAARPPKLG